MRVNDLRKKFFQAPSTTPYHLNAYGASLILTEILNTPHDHNTSAVSVTIWLIGRQPIFNGG